MCLLGLICSYPCWAAYSDNIDDLYDELSTCVTNLASDIECVEAVQDGLEYMSNYADAVSATILLCTMLAFDAILFLFELLNFVTNNVLFIELSVFGQSVYRLMRRRQDCNDCANEAQITMPAFHI